MDTKFKLPEKLNLSKETIAALNEEQLTTIAGGGDILTSSGPTCSCIKLSCLSEDTLAVL